MSYQIAFLLDVFTKCCEDCINNIPLVVVCPETKTGKVNLIFQKQQINKRKNTKEQKITKNTNKQKTLSFITGSVCLCVYMSV